jgi:hypothetical protein
MDLKSIIPARLFSNNAFGKISARLLSLPAVSVKVSFIARQVRLEESGTTVNVKDSKKK